LEGENFGDSGKKYLFSSFCVFRATVEMATGEVYVGPKFENEAMTEDEETDFHQQIFNFLLKKELPQSIFSLNQPYSVFLLNEAANYCVSSF
jgi:hypothetical protein